MKNRSLAMIAVPLGVVGIVLLLVVPVPAAMLDLLIIVNILLTLVILLTSMFVKKPLDFSVFPSLLLVATLFRLGLNVASTRLVLGDGYAGEVIGAFGHIVVDGNLVIGIVVFLILVVIQFLVVTKGAERVAEVGARFTLDAMPGKQMAIDADLNAGLISEKDARARRAEISAEADFYGAMDGASKFVKGDAIAGIVITLINLLGGIVIGVAMHGMPVAESVDTYSILTVGDGLVTQVPALLMAVATGMIVTRSNSAEGDIGSQASGQLVQSRQAVAIAGVAAIALGLVEGMPKLPFLVLGIGLLVAAQQIRASQRRAEAARAAAARQEEREAASPDGPDELIEQMRVHALEILLAPDLVDLVTGAHDDLLGRVRALRRKIALDLGVVVPPVRTRDSIDLPVSTYAVRIAGVEAGRGQAPAGKVLALGDDLGSLPGQATVDPVFGMAGRWVPVEMRHSAEMAGATVIDRVSVLVTHLSALITANAGRLLSREDVRVLTEEVKRTSPSAVDELTPSLLSLAEIQRVLQGLLDEQVAINDLLRIYEALALAARRSTEPEHLVEAARAALGPAVPARHTVDGTIAVVTVAPALEQAMLAGRQGGEAGTTIVLDPARLDAVRTSVTEQVRAARSRGADPVLVCAPSLRPAVHRLTTTAVPDLPVLSYAEVVAGNATVETVGVVTDAPALAARG